MVTLAGEKTNEDHLPRHRLYFCLGANAQLAAGRDARGRYTFQSLRYESDRKGLPIGKGRVPLDHFYRQRIEPPPGAIHESPSTACTAAEPPAH